MRLKSIAVVLCALLLGACATPPRKYQPPDATKMNASRQRLGQAVEKSRATAGKAKSQVVEAQKISVTVNEKLMALKKKAPKELVPLIEEIEAGQKEEDGKLTEAIGTQTVLESQLTEADAAKVQHEKDDGEYQGKAQLLADNATKENQSAVSAEKKLSWYRWHWFGSWIVLGLGVLACGVFAFLKFTGRLAFSGAQIASKL